MMKQTFKALCILGLLICCVFGPVLWAADQAVTTETPDKSETQSRLEKLSRGLSNVVYGPLEIIYQLKEEIKRNDPFRGVMPGLVKGVSWCFMREGVGIYELLTFYIPEKAPLKEFDVDWLYA